MCCLGLGGGGGGGGSKSWRRELGLTNTAHIDTNTHTPTHIQACTHWHASSQSLCQAKRAGSTKGM